jgi:hypothetical protein
MLNAFDFLYPKVLPHVTISSCPACSLALDSREARNSGRLQAGEGANKMAIF